MQTLEPKHMTIFKKLDLSRTPLLWKLKVLAQKSTPNTLYQVVDPPIISKAHTRPARKTGSTNQKTKHKRKQQNKQTKLNLRNKLKHLAQVPPSSPRPRV